MAALYGLAMNTQSRPLTLTANLQTPLFARVDVVLVALAIFACAAVLGLCALVADIAFVGLLLATILAVSVPAAIALVPLRVMYLAIRQSCCSAMAFVIAALISVGLFAAVHLSLRQGPDTSRALTYIAKDTPLMPITHVGDTPVSLLFLNGEQRSWANGGGPFEECLYHCQTLLKTGLASEVAIISTQASPAPAVRYHAAADGACPEGQLITALLADHCAVQDPAFLAGLTYEISVLPANAPAFERIAPVQAVYRVTIRSGAMSQTVHIIRANVATGGGLIAPVIAAARGEPVHFIAQRPLREFAAFDLRRTAPLPDWHPDPLLPQALNALFAQTLGG